MTKIPDGVYSVENGTLVIKVDKNLKTNELCFNHGKVMKFVDLSEQGIGVDYSMFPKVFATISPFTLDGLPMLTLPERKTAEEIAEDIVDKLYKGPLNFIDQAKIVRAGMESYHNQFATQQGMFTREQILDFAVNKFLRDGFNEKSINKAYEELASLTPSPKEIEVKDNNIVNVKY